jgi:hypothetical protein
MIQEEGSASSKKLEKTGLEANRQTADNPKFLQPVFACNLAGFPLVSNAAYKLSDPSSFYKIFFA